MNPMNYIVPGVALVFVVFLIIYALKIFMTELKGRFLKGFTVALNIPVALMVLFAISGNLLVSACLVIFSLALSIALAYRKNKKRLSEADASHQNANKKSKSEKAKSVKTEAVAGLQTYADAEFEKAPRENRPAKPNLSTNTIVSYAPLTPSQLNELSRRLPTK